MEHCRWVVYDVVVQHDRLGLVTALVEMNKHRATQTAVILNKYFVQLDVHNHALAKNFSVPAARSHPCGIRGSTSSAEVIVIVRSMSPKPPFRRHRHRIFAFEPVEVMATEAYCNSTSELV